MTYDQYWYGDVWMVVDYIKADEERQKRQNQEAWLQGMYFYDALSCAFANAFKKKGEQPAKYPEEPYKIFKEEDNAALDERKKEEREEQERLQARLYMQQMVWAGKNWGG